MLCPSRKGGRIVAVVRGGSDEEAARRLRVGYDSGDPDLLAKFDSLSAQYLTVYAGMQSPC